MRHAANPGNVSTPKSRTIPVLIAFIVLGAAMLGTGLFLQLEASADKAESPKSNNNVMVRPLAPSSVTASGQNLTLTLSASWLNVPTKAAELPGFFAQNERKHPRLSALITPESVAGLAIYAVAFDDTGRIRGTLNVTSQADTTPAVDLLKQAPGFVSAQGGTNEQASLERFGQYPGVRVSFELPGVGELPASYQQVVFIVGPRSTAQLTVTAASATAAKALMDNVAPTIAFK